MGVNLSGLINAGTQAAGNYEHAKAQAGQQQIGAILQAIKLQRDQQADALKQAIGMRTLRTPVLGDPGYAQAQGDVAGAQANARVPAAVSQARQIAPIDIGKAVAIESGKAPIDVKKAVDIETATQPIKTKGAIDVQNAKPEMTSYQSAMLSLYRKKLADTEKQQAAKANVQTPDQIKSQTVQSLADPAADALTAYYTKGGPQGAAPYLSGMASHIPVVGNKIANATDNGADYQTALSNARVLGTQYLEIMPKSRFQPSTIDDIMQQIAPAPGDNPMKQAQKAARVVQLKAAIRKRAMLRPDAQGPSLNDIPEPPSGVDQP